MLTQRLLSALVLIPLVIIALFFLPLSIFAMVMVAVCGLAAWEWSQFLGYKTKKTKGIFGLCFALLAALIYFCPVNIQTKEMIYKSIVILSVVWWLIALLLVMGYPKSKIHWQNSKPLKLMFAFFTLIPFFIGMILIRRVEYSNNSYYGAFLLLYILILVWAMDSGAYFAGRAWGKHKLAPHVSPGKTIEGMAGGLIVSFAIAIIIYFSHYFSLPLYELFISSALAILASVLGDLTESMFKREANIKDSGNMIPGHGGILDRVDSLTAAIPVFCATLFYLS